MRPTNPSDSSSRHQPSINETSAQDDTMLMGFEFFDEKGRFNPRNVLFSAQTSPSKTNSIVTTLFGTVMQWRARSWAKKFLKNVQKNYVVSTGESKKNIEDLLTDVRKKRSVEMTRFFVISMPILKQIKSLENFEATDTTLKSTRSSGFNSALSIINIDEIIRYYSPIFENKECESNFLSLNTIDNPSDRKEELAKAKALKEACQVIETQWEELSKINDGELAPPQYKLPVKSGFLDYCRQRSVKQTDKQATEQAIWSNRFSGMDEKEWSKYQKMMTGPQYQAWTSKRNEWISLISKRGEPPSEKQPLERDLRLELRTEQPVFNAEPEPTLTQEFSNYSADFMAASHGRGRLPLPVEEIVDSGFLTYCNFGIAAFDTIDIDVLEEFLNKYQKKWDVFGKILTPSQFIQLKKHRDKVDQDIADFRANHPSPVSASSGNINEENDLPQTDISDIQKGIDNVVGLFSGALVINFGNLNQIEWNGIDLHRKISLDDAKKLRDYFSSAEINQENFDICKKIEGLSRKIRQIGLSENRPFREDSESNIQDPVDVLAGIYSSYFRRYTLVTRAKEPESKTKISSEKTKSAKKIKPKLKIQPKKYTKSRAKTDTKKSSEKQIVGETKTLAQEARDQIKEANELIKRINEKI